MLERNNPKPLYAQLEDILRTRIMNEEWMPDNAIPSENELSRMYGLSRVTVRAVITQLVKEGLLYRVQGKGTFVAKPKITTTPSAYMGFAEQFKRMGYEMTTQLLSISYVTAPQPIARKLQVPIGEVLCRIERLRYLKREPFSLHYSYLQASRFPNIETQDFSSGQLCDILKREYGLETVTVRETLELVLATTEEASHLQVGRNHPLLRVDDTFYLATNEPFVAGRSLFKGDKMTLSFEYRKENHCD